MLAALSSFRLATRPAVFAARHFSATPLVRDDLFLRGIPFGWERPDLENFLQESNIPFERVSVPPSDRRPTGNRGYAFVTVAPDNVENVLATHLHAEGRDIEFRR